MDNLEQEIETPKQENSQENNDQSEDGLLKRYKEQVAGSKREAERLRSMVIDSEVAKASKDSGSLLELHGKDLKLANEVAKRFGYLDYSDAESVIKKSNTKEVEDKKNGLTEDEFERMYQKRRQKEEHERAIQKVEKVFSKLDESTQEKAKTYFEKITKGQTLDTETALEFAEMTTLYVNKDKIKSEKFDDGLELLSSTGLSKSKKVSDSKEEWVIRNGQLVLISNK